MPGQINQSVVKAFEILQLFDESRNEITTTDIADELGLSLVSAHRYLRTLESIGALVAVTRRRYRLSYIFVDIYNRLLQADSVGGVLQPLLNILTSELQEMSTAAVFRAGAVTCVASAIPRQRSSIEIGVASQLDIFRVAHGRVWLAFMSERQAAEHFGTFERTRLARTLVSRQEPEFSISETKRLGYVTINGESENDNRIIAAPCFTQGGSLVASLAVLGPTSRLSGNAFDLAKKRLQTVAANARNRLY